MGVPHWGSILQDQSHYALVALCLYYNRDLSEVSMGKCIGPIRLGSDSGDVVSPVVAIVDS